MIKMAKWLRESQPTGFCMVQQLTFFVSEKRAALTPVEEQQIKKKAEKGGGKKKSFQIIMYRLGTFLLQFLTF